MEKYPLYLDGKAAGELTAAETGMYTEYFAACHEPGTELLRAFLVGERGEVRLGVLAPESGALTIRRRLSRQEAAGIGKLLRCEARRSEDERWQRVPPSGRPLTTPYFQERDAAGALTRTEPGRRYVAIPYDPKRLFPMPALFCFAKICRIGGGAYAVFTFDGREMPLMP